MHSSAILHGLAKTLRLSLKDLEKLEEGTASKFDKPNALVSHLKRLHIYEDYAVKSKHLATLEESIRIKVKKSPAYFHLHTEEKSLLQKLEEAAGEVAQTFIQATCELDIAEEELKTWKAKIDYKKQPGYKKVQENYRQKLAAFYKHAVGKDSQGQLLKAEAELKTASEAFEKLKNTSNYQSSPDYKSIRATYKSKLRHFNNQLTCLEPFITTANKRYLALHKERLEQMEKIKKNLKTLENEHLAIVFMKVFKETSELLATTLFHLSPDYNVALLAHTAKDKAALLGKDSNLEPPAKFYKQVFETRGYDGSSPLQWMEVHAKMSGQNKDDKSANASLSVTLLEWMYKTIGKNPAAEENERADLAEMLNREFNEALALYYNDKPIIDPKTNTQTGVSKPSKEEKAMAVQKWFSHVAYYAHHEALKKLIIHYGSDPCAELLAKMDIVLSDRAQFQTLAEKYKIENLFVLAYKGLWGGMYVYAKDQAEALIRDAGNIENPALYALLESVDPEARNWHRVFPDFYCTLESTNNKVAAAASVINCPRSIIHKLFEEIDPHLNDYYQNYSGLAYAARNENLPVVEWFVDEKAHPNHKPHRELWNGVEHPFRQAVSSSSDNTQILRLLLQYYATPVNAMFSAVLLSSHKDCNPTHTKKPRFLKAAHALLPYIWPSDVRGDFVKASEINLDPSKENADSKQTAASATKTTPQKVSLAGKDWVLFDLSKCFTTLDELKNNDQHDDLRFLLTLVNNNLGGKYLDFKKILDQYAEILKAPKSLPPPPKPPSYSTLFAPVVKEQTGSRSVITLSRHYFVTGNTPQPGPTGVPNMDDKHIPTSAAAPTKGAP